MKLKTLILPIFCSFLITLDSVSAEICFNGYFKFNSTYDLKRRSLLSSLASDVTTHKGFYSSSIGQDTNQIFITGMCIPETKPETCSKCVKGATDSLLQICPNQTVGYTWTDCCMVRYSNISFSGSLITEPNQPVSNPEAINVNLTLFDIILEELMSRTKTEATRNHGSSSLQHKYYAAEVASLTDSLTIYAMMQCTPDVSSEDCEYCLKKSIVDYKGCCDGSKGGSFLRPYCYLRWDLNPFAGAFENISFPPPPPQFLPRPPLSPLSLTPPLSDRNNTTGKDGKAISIGIIVAIIVLIVFVLVLFVVGFAVWRRRKSHQTFEVQGLVLLDDFFFELSTRNESHTNSGKKIRCFHILGEAGDEITRTHSVQFSFKKIEAATDNFSECNMIGQGGFGEVYRGKLSNGTEVAVKRLSKRSGQGEQEFKNEAVLLTKLQHRNLVRLLGFCFEGEEKILVYEFVTNKSLDYFLFDPEKQGELDWTKRYNIIGGIARGILYLHQDSRLTIIHRDLKASNILLDADMNPKITDFGMARIFGVDETQANTGRIVGTYGYMSPEYAMCGHFSMKSDVSSFGILILEIISGKKNSSFYHIDDTGGNLVTHAWRLWRNWSSLELVDPTIGESYKSNEATRCIHIALLCIQEDPADRPTSPAIIVMLTSNTSTLPVPRSPVFFASSRHESDPHSLESSTQSTSSFFFYFHYSKLEFKTEAVVVAKLQHRNLVRLLGFSLQGEERILVYEYMLNKSLDYILFDPAKQVQLDWTRRYNIIGGIGRGILYLHQDSRLTIIHRDLKASNILLDADMNPKIADFGMARIFGLDQTQENTSRIVGTYGYMSPEYAMHGQFSMKSDVYSFGVLVLEIISGRKNSSFDETDNTQDLVTYAWRLWRNGTALDLVDPIIVDHCQKSEVVRCIHIGLLCVQEDPVVRPTMSTIFVMLTSNTATLPVPQQPGFFVQSTRLDSDQSTITKSVSVSVDDASISDLYPR